MHYYQFNIKDYRKDTGHLSLIEHAIYRSLMDTYYLNEMPLCKDVAKLMRSHSVRSNEEKIAFDAVLSDFFVLEDDGYHHEKCDEVLNKIYDKSAKARASAQKRWEKHNANRMRTHSESNAKGMLPINPLTHIPNNPVNKTLDQQVDPDDKKNADNDFFEKLFDQFWQSGIRKAGKKAAKSAFKKIISKKVQKQEFTDYLVRDIQFRLTNEQQGFDLLHPTTYLNGERWTDEKLTRSNKSSNTGDLSFLDDDDDTGWIEEIYQSRGMQLNDNQENIRAYEQELENVVSVQASMEEFSDEKPRAVPEGVPKPTFTSHD